MESHLARFRLRKPSRNVGTGLPASNARSRTDPSTGRITSCERCRQFKKKCDRSPPECTRCAKAGVECSLGPSASEVGLHTQSAWIDGSLDQKNNLYNNSASEVQLDTVVTEDIDKRKATATVDNPLTSNTLETPTQLHSIGQPIRPIDGESPATEDTDLEPSTKSICPENTRSPFQDNYPIPLEATSLSSRRSLVDAYFRDIHLAYPFVDRNRIFAALYNGSISVLSSSEENDVDATMLYLVMAIGHNTLERAGHVAPSEHIAFDIKYKDIVSQCLAQENADVVRIMLLLATYSLFDARGYSTWSLVDIAARLTMRLGLNRRDIADKGLLPSEAEHQHRLYWSVYVFDRMTATSLGTPATMNDVGIDIPLPGLTVEEFASPERMEPISTLQAARHIIHLRQLEDKVHQMRLCNRIEDSSFPYAPYRNTVTTLRTEVENWYSSGCLLKSASPDNVTINITIPWLAARYYSLLLYLYYPSDSGLAIAQLPESELLSLAQKHIQANAVRFQQRQLPLNRMTLYRLLPVCMVFLHCFFSHNSSEPFSAGAEISICADIMEEYSAEWGEARRGADIMRQFASLVISVSTPVSGPLSSAHSRAFREADRAWCHAIRVSLIQLAEEVLGPGSIYTAIKNLWTHSSEGDYQFTNLAQKEGIIRQDGILDNSGTPANPQGTELDASPSDGFHAIDLL
ncbi:fungal-specific transcription factor domain-containing protein [Hypoxylon sp. NC1633]|nr:fungal-specific transcription factor domain-containing protein [Hypoxylon sp. NC1633]